MTTARAFLDRLTSEFATDIKMEQVVRKLQQKKRIPLGGRGRSGYQLTTADAALILLAYLGSLKAAKAAERLKSLEKLTPVHSNVTLIERFVAILSGELGADRICVGRNRKYAQITYSDGSEQIFLGNSQGESELFDPNSGFLIEAVLCGDVIARLVDFLKGDEHERSN